ncbi:serine/threonine-protein kinase [Mycolicibacterium mageritense]|uniref:serine/threonine-protein kinase n=1 Tax=Mycolicibacterium mageritense TaxID=53462 RepID=UPI001E63C5C5|nr:serine/threonine-protein kinase [Mycolicibacterium mageritense]GJJ20728.1 serine/threonine-protein kinase PknK [Mycolicibacterium mageritense]
MGRNDPLPTQRDLTAGIPAELAAAGFEDPEEIGRGGFGVVYRCNQTALGRTVAVKVLTADLEPDNVERFVREQIAMGKLSGHPNIVNIFQVGAVASGRPYIVMQYHPHGSLDSKILEDGPIGWQDALRVGVKMAGALETAHRRATLHRDVKPANILLTEYGEPQLTDFGIARIIGGFETSDGAVTGSPAYTAPEVLLGQPPGVTSDIYSLASTLFSAATGHAVFERRKGEQMVAQFLRITRQPMPNLGESGLPADVCTAIEQAMSRNIEDRPATAEEFGEQLRELQRRHGLPVDDMPVPIPAPAIRMEPTTPPGTPSSGSRLRTMTPPAPATRFRLPVSTRSLVERTRLIDVLRTQQHKKLTVIHGPTGFGKSTLASQWAKALVADGVVVAWLTVDHDDNNVVWFLSHLIEAIRTVTPALASDLCDVLEEHGDEAERYVLTSLINEIHQNDTRMTLVIDDWHRVTDPATIAALRYLVDNVASGLTVVVTSRSQSGLPMSRMRMQGELVEIDSTALRFDVAESEHFLVDLSGLDLDHTDVEELTAKTDGWVAALQLASLSLRDRDDPVELIGTMTGRHHAISEFLAENVLDTLEPSMLDFLLATSITERICGGLAAALTGVPDGLAMLERVEERDLFLRRIDEQWFRYHQLFRDFLRHRLSRDTPERVTRLHRLASDWCAEHGLISEAVDHALAAGDEQRAVTIVENDGLTMVANSQMATLIGLAGKLPPGAVQSHPRLQLALAWANIVLHRISSAEQALELVDSTLDGCGLSADEIADIRAEAGVVRGVSDLRSDRLAGIDGHIALCLQRRDRLRPFSVASAANVATFAAAYRYDLDEVNRIQAWAAPFYERSGDAFTIVNGLCFTGLAYHLVLDNTTAEQYFRRALRIAKRSGGVHSYTARLASSLLGELLYERGDLDEAERLLDEGYKLGPEGGSVDFKIARYVINARIKALQGDRLAAAQRLDEATRVARNLSLNRLRALAEHERIRLGLPPHPEFGPMPVTSYDARRQPVDAMDEIAVQFEEASAIRTLIKADDPAKRDLACRWAREWVDRLAQQNRPQAMLRARRLLGACLAADGRTADAKALIAGVAAQCAQLQMLRYLVDGGPHVVATLSALRAAQRAGRWDPEWPEVPAEFLDQALNAVVPQRV